MPIYEVWEEGGATETFEADSVDEAIEIAEDWIRDGSYDGPVMVQYWVQRVDEDGEPVGPIHRGEIQAGPDPKPPRTSCGEEDEDHDWQMPHEVVGGVRENPGVWSLGGTAMLFKQVCSRCGLYRVETHSGAQRNPGQLEVEIEYREPDEISRRWVESQTDYCDQCGGELTAEMRRLGWPLLTEFGCICPACYGDEAYCSECGELLPADEDVSRCEECREADDE